VIEGGREGGRREKMCRLLVGNLKERETLEDQSLGREKVLKWLFKQSDDLVQDRQSW
jgi:hypothetical protein